MILTFAIQENLVLQQCKNMNMFDGKIGNTTSLNDTINILNNRILVQKLSYCCKNNQFMIVLNNDYTKYLHEIRLAMPKTGH